VDEETSRRQGSIRFARDVGVNVLANLIAVPILYLIGVLAGLFPRDPQAIALAITIVLSVAFLLVGLVSQFLKGTRQLKALCLSIVLAGCMILVSGIADIDIDVPFPRWAIILWGIATVAAGANTYVVATRKPDARR
jgi:predicted tellurium resistance membrane protein TerC